jgi:hypothetical protein
VSTGRTMKRLESDMDGLRCAQDWG